jgi:hypothetical protein
VPLTVFDRVIVDELADPVEVERIRELGVTVEMAPMLKKSSS